MKILFATDGSAHALAALKALIDHLDWFRDQVDLTLINVHPELPYRRAAGWAGKDAIACGASPARTLASSRDGDLRVRLVS